MFILYVVTNECIICENESEVLDFRGFCISCIIDEHSKRNIHYFHREENCRWEVLYGLIDIGMAWDISSLEWIENVMV